MLSLWFTSTNYHLGAHIFATLQSAMTKEEMQQSIAAELKRIREKKTAIAKNSHTGISRKMKRKLKMKDGGFAVKNPEALEKARATMYRQMMKSGYVAKSKHSTPTKKLALALGEHACGESQRDVEKKYALANGTVNKVLQRIFPSREAMEDCLENLLLSNALLCGDRIMELAPSMTANEASVATGIMTQRYLETRKARANHFSTDVPVAVIIRLEQTMEKIKQVHGRVIEVDTPAIEDKK